MKESEAERKHKSATVPGSPHAKTNLRQSSIPDSTLWIPGTDSWFFVSEAWIPDSNP